MAISSVQAILLEMTDARPIAYPHPPSGIPTKMCKRVVETHIPFMSNRFLEEEEWKTDELS